MSHPGASQPANTSRSNDVAKEVGPQPYPPCRADDAVEGIGTAAEDRAIPGSHDRLGPGGDPAEGKR